MSLLEKIRGLFGKGQLPEETKLLLSGVADVSELQKGLDDIITSNEVEARDIEREIEKLAKMEAAQKERIANAELNTREKTNILREIKRLRQRMNSLDKRHRIHQDNIDLHLGLFNRISEMEAMELKKVTQSQIEEITADYGERYEAHRDLVSMGRASNGLEGSLYEDSAEQAELAALEREILAEYKPETPEPEAVVEIPEPTVAKPTVAEPPAEEPELTEAQKTARASIDAELAKLEAEDEAAVEHDERALELE